MALLDGKISEPFKIDSGVKQDCALAPTLYRIFFSLMLTYAFGTVSDGIYLHTRYDGKLFNLKMATSKDQSHLCPHKGNAFCS